MKIRTFVINLARSKDRRKNIQKHLDTIGLPFELIEAVDGNNLTQDYIDSNFDLEKSGKKWIPMNQYQISIVLSHRKIFEKMIKENIQEDLVLEDDAIISKDYVELLKTRKNWIPQDSDVVLLGHRVSSWINHQKTFKINSKYTIGKMYLIAAGAHGYYITLKGVSKLLKKMKQKIIKPADSITGDAVFGKHKLYAVFLQRRTRKLIIDYNLPAAPFIWLQYLFQKLKL